MDFHPLGPHRNTGGISLLLRLDRRQSVSYRTFQEGAVACCLPHAQQDPKEFAKSANANNHRQTYSISICAAAVACVFEKKAPTPDHRGVLSHLCLAIGISPFGSNV